VSGIPRSAILHHKPKNGECVWLEATRASIRPLPGEEGAQQVQLVQALRIDRHD
jgi:hypothetical protein